MLHRPQILRTVLLIVAVGYGYHDFMVFGQTSGSDRYLQQQVVRLLGDLRSGNVFEQREAAEALNEIDPRDVRDLELRKDVARAFRKAAFQTHADESSIEGLVHWGGNRIAWAGEDLLLVGTDLVDTRRRVIRWRYDGESFPGQQWGTLYWSLMQSQGIRGLVPVTIPHPEAMAAETSEVAPFVVESGGEIAVTNQVGGDRFKNRIKDMGIEDVLTARAAIADPGDRPICHPGLCSTRRCKFALA
jgi:hypothetical protein